MVAVCWHSRRAIRDFNGQVILVRACAIPTPAGIECFLDFLQRIRLCELATDILFRYQAGQFLLEGARLEVVSEARELCQAQTAPSVATFA